MQENETMVENKTKKTRKTKKTKQSKFKAKYLVPVIFALVVLVVGFSVFQSLFQSGPIYGERCAGVTEIAVDDLESVQNSVEREISEIEDLLIEVHCKTIAIDLKLSAGVDETRVDEICSQILLAIDEKIGLSKSNSESQYSDLFGTYNGKTQYHVDFTIEGSDDLFPAFASKHPNSDEINYTFNSARNPDLVDELLSDTEDEE